MAGRLTLLELNMMVSSAVADSLPGVYWVETELLEMRESRGHCYMEVIQKDVFSSSLVARASAKCWRTQWQKIAKKFVEVTGGVPRAGMKLLLKVSAEFHPSYGFALIVSDIDPSYTLGEIAQKRREIILRLKEEGIFDLQRGLRLPLFCQRIAVISSETAAGYGDFCGQLAGNEYGFSFTQTLFPAIMQGDMTSRSIVEELDKINDRQDEFDCVVIIRGGGATSDMSGFDSLELAENVANFPLPVITGIGHERDECVIDLIAYQKLKTPTAVAAFLVGHLLEVSGRIEAAKDRLVAGTNSIIDRCQVNLHHLFLSMKSGSLLCCAKEDGRVKRLNMRLKSAMRSRVQNENYRLSLLVQRIEGLNPLLMLKRGYTMTFLDGKTVKDVSCLQPGQEIETVFEKGKIKSIVK